MLIAADRDSMIDRDENRAKIRPPPCSSPIRQSQDVARHSDIDHNHVRPNSSRTINQ